MYARMIPPLLLTYLSLVTMAVGQTSDNQGQLRRSASSVRLTPVAARVEDATSADQDPVPTPPAEWAAPDKSVVAGQPLVRPLPPSMTQPLNGPHCWECNTECGGNCQTEACGCQHCQQRAKCPPCPPARWNVLGRIGYSWNTRTKPWLQASHWGYPEEFCERPFGQYVRASLCPQIENGLRDQLILNRCDFVDDTLPDAYQLKPRGRYELSKIVALIQQRPALQRGFDAIYVEESGNPELDEARRQHVLQQLSLLQFAVAPEQVAIGRPTTPGISGDEALAVYANLQKLWVSGNRGSGGTGQSSWPGIGNSGGGSGMGAGMGSSGAGGVGQ